MQLQLHRSLLFTDWTWYYFTCSNFEDIFDVRHFIDSVRDEVRIIKRLPKRFGRRYGYQTLAMPPISWSNEKYYLEQVWIFSSCKKIKELLLPIRSFKLHCNLLPLPRLFVSSVSWWWISYLQWLIFEILSFYRHHHLRNNALLLMFCHLNMQILPLYGKYKVIHFNRTDTRLANNGISLELQRLRCRVNFQALKFTPQIEALGQKLVRILRDNGPFLALHLRYEMDMLAFSGCTHGCSLEEAEELKRLR